MNQKRPNLSTTSSTSHWNPSNPSFSDESQATVIFEILPSYRWQNAMLWIFMAMNMDYDSSSFLSAYKCPVSNMTLSQSGILWEQQLTNTVTAWIYRKNQQYFIAILLFPGCNIVLQCLHSLAFFNHRAATDICMLLEKWSFFHEFIVTKSQSSLILLPHFIKTKQSPPFPCCQPQKKDLQHLRVCIQPSRACSPNQAGCGEGFTISLWLTPTRSESIYNCLGTAPYFLNIK